MKFAGQLATDARFPDHQVLKVHVKADGEVRTTLQWSGRAGSAWVSRRKTPLSLWTTARPAGPPRRTDVAPVTR